MPLGKVKSSKQKLRLKARRDAWDNMPTDKKQGKKTGRYSFTKPGSNKK